MDLGITRVVEGGAGYFNWSMKKGLIVAVWAAASEVALEQRADVSQDISLYFYRYQGDPKLVYVDARGVVEPTRLVPKPLGITRERKKRYKVDDKSCFCSFLVSV